MAGDPTPKPIFEPRESATPLRQSLEAMDVYMEFLDYQVKNVVQLCQEIAETTINKEWVDAKKTEILRYLFRPTDKKALIARHEVPSGRNGKDLGKALDNLEFDAIEYLTSCGVEFFAPAIGEKFDIKIDLPDEYKLIYINSNPEKHNIIHSVLTPGIKFGNEIIQRSDVTRFAYFPDVEPTENLPFTIADIFRFCQEISRETINREWLVANMERIYSVLFKPTNKGQFIASHEVPKGYTGREFAEALDELEYSAIETLAEAGVCFYAPAINDAFEDDKHEIVQIATYNNIVATPNTVYKIFAPGMVYGDEILKKSAIMILKDT